MPSKNVNLTRKKCPDFQLYQKLLYKHLSKEEAVKYAKIQFYHVFEREYAALTTTRITTISNWVSGTKRDASDDILKAFAEKYLSGAFAEPAVASYVGSR